MSEYTSTFNSIFILLKDKIFVRISVVTMKHNNFLENYRDEL